MAPRFGRTRKLAEPHVMLAVDCSFTIIWLSAFATQAAYNTSGLCGQACNISKAVVGLGVFVWYALFLSFLLSCRVPRSNPVSSLLFAASTFVSGYTLTYWKFHGNLPGYDNRKLRTGDNNIDPDKAAFSMAPHDEEAYERINADDHDTSNPYVVDPARYGHANPYSHDDGNEPNSYGAVPPQHRSDLFNQDTEYTSGGGVDLPAGSSSHTYAAGARVSYSDQPAKFPSGHYDRVDQ